MKKQLFIALILIELFSSCDTIIRDKTQPAPINYSDKNVLDSLIKIIPYSTDTVFLGFWMGMTKNDYKNHITQLRSEGKTITYSSSNRFSSALVGEFNLGAGYTFKTNISIKLSVSDKTFTGEGKYFIEPIYNETGNLVMLNILPIEKWDGDTGFNTPNWLETKINQSSKRLSDNALKQYLIDNEIIDSNDLIREKGNVIIYSSTLTISYVDLKTQLIEMFTKEIEKEIIEKETKDIKF